MRKVNVAEDIIPIAEFKTHASEYLRRMHSTHRPMVITQNGRPAAVVITPEEFEELGYRQFAKAKIASGLESADSSPSRSIESVEKRIKARIRKTHR